MSTGTLQSVMTCMWSACTDEELQIISKPFAQQAPLFCSNGSSENITGRNVQSLHAVSCLAAKPTMLVHHKVVLFR